MAPDFWLVRGNSFKNLITYSLFVTHYSDDGEEVNLLYSKQEVNLNINCCIKSVIFHATLRELQVLPLQDFDGEVRPTIDVEQFLEQCVLLLDDEAAQTSTPVDLVDLLLGKMDLPVAVVEEAKTILVTHDIGT